MQKENQHFAILWDMDGVLVDTWDLHSQTWLEAFQEYDIPLTIADIKATFGMNSLMAMQSLLGDRYDNELLIKVIDLKETLFRDLVAGKMVLLPGVGHWLEMFHALGVRQAVASSAPFDNILAVVNDLGIERFLDAIVSGADLPGKPNPDVFLEAARMVGAEPKNCLVIEDAVHGVQGARNAGMKCIAVTTTSPADVLNGADLVLNDLTELTEERLSFLI